MILSYSHYNGGDMNRKLNLLLAGIFFGGMALSGCNMPTTTTCPTADLQAVALGSPAMWAIVDTLSPTLTWTYPDPSCNPEGYRIDLHTGPLFTDDLSGGTGNPSTSWSPGSPLQPGREYSWAIRPINGTTLGPIAGYRYFFTGPMCATAALSAPSLIEPADGSEVNELYPSLKWQYLDGCLPEGYRVDLSIDPTFADTSLSGGTGNPSTRWGPGEDLADCTTYFWRTAPINDTTLGPFSSVFSFRTNTGGCAPEPTGSISGVVWVDECPLPLDTSPVPDPLPAGCAETVYGVDGDAIHQPDEDFLDGISVNIGPGDCPMGGPKTTITDPDGAYAFNLLPPGKYCININAADFAGPGAMGHWTLLPSGHEGNTYRSVVLGAGQVLTGQDFAWYQDAGPTPTPVDTFTPTLVATFTPTLVGLNFTPNLNANCRFGPDPLFNIVDVAMKGTPYLLDGQNQAHTWYRIMLSELRGCWVLASSGVASGDVSNLRVLVEPKLPTFTPTRVPTDTPTKVPPVECKRYTDEKSCEAQTACEWVPAVTTPGFCRNK